MFLSLIKLLPSIIDVNKYSSVRKLLIVSAWIFRFLKNIRINFNDRHLDKYISSDERSMALNFWIKINQNILVNSDNYEDVKCSLNLIEDEKGIIRAYGRIQQAKIPEETLKPIMLERSHHFAELILWDCHIRVKHNGVRETLIEFQSQYWVTRSKSFVKKILNKCVLCKFLNSRQYSYPKSPELPDIRFKDDRAFAVTGIDHFGPLYCKSNFREISPEEEDIHNCHVLLYTCASSRGIILDLVPDTSSKEVVNSLKRFIARRGCPQEILSDNGSAFSATETQRFASDRSINWKYSLTKARWYGAIWERLIQSVKRCLKRVIGRETLNLIELQTVLIEIEAILNSRPLCPLYDDDFIHPLTPNHLLFGRKLEQYNSTAGDIEINFNVGKKRARYIETIIDHFWERWRGEYVSTLRNWSAKYKRRNSLIPEIGDIVLIFEEKTPRHKWSLGTVSKLWLIFNLLLAVLKRLMLNLRRLFF